MVSYEIIKGVQFVRESEDAEDVITAEITESKFTIRAKGSISGEDIMDAAEEIDVLGGVLQGRGWTGTLSRAGMPGYP